MITPFQYQTKAALSFPEYFVNNDGNPLCVIPTAGGKSVVIALFLKWIFEQWPDQRVLLLTHVRELISQDYDELLRLWPEAPVGIDSAGLKQREYGSKIIFGGIQSLHRNAHRLPRIDLGRLVPPVSLAARTQIDTSGVGTRGGEFIAGQLEAAALDPEVVARIADEIVKHGADRQGWLVFCCGVAHGEALDEALRERDVASAAIFGETKSDERDRIITMFKAGELRALCSVPVLTTGFNATHVDLVALARATKSTGLFIQMVGRGLRVHPGKVDCRILDFGGNIERHGPVDVPRVRSKSTTNGEGEAPFKICPECGQAHPTAQRECECGYAFPPPERRIHITASTAEPLATKAPPEWIEVERVTYRRHHKPGKVPSLRVDYHAGLISYPEWICLEHTEYPRSKAVGWWCRRGPELPVPDTVDEALRLVSALREPTHILVRRVGPYDEIVGTRL